MMRECSRCGAPAIDDTSVFCNRCGARLPSVMYCRKCGTPVTDPLSQFCDHCGSPLALPSPAAIPPITLAKGKVCPACGFENFIDDARFCKKCGSIIGTGSESVQDRRRQDRAAGAMPDGRSPVRQEPVRMPATAPQEPPGGPVAPVQAPAGGQWAVQEIPGESAPDQGMEAVRTKPRWSWRKIALAAAAIIILLLFVTAVIFLGVPALSGNSSANATAPGLIGSLLPGDIAGYEPVINQSTPVIVDTPLDVK
jgi:hypothetical protein